MTASEPRLSVNERLNHLIGLCNYYKRDTDMVILGRIIGICEGALLANEVNFLQIERILEIAQKVIGSHKQFIIELAEDLLADMPLPFGLPAEIDIEADMDAIFAEHEQVKAMIDSKSVTIRLDAEDQARLDAFMARALADIDDEPDCGCPKPGTDDDDMMLQAVRA